MTDMFVVHAVPLENHHRTTSPPWLPPSTASPVLFVPYMVQPNSTPHLRNQRGGVSRESQTTTNRRHQNERKNCNASSVLCKCIPC